LLKMMSLYKHTVYII